jgi:hypothetical protein
LAVGLGSGVIIFLMMPLERVLETALLRLYDLWKSVGYRAIYFKRMLTASDRIYKGPVGTVRHLLGKKPGEKSGFHRLAAAGKLEWTIEALFEGEQRWHELFTLAEIETARERYRSARRT